MERAREETKEKRKDKLKEKEEIFRKRENIGREKI